MDAEYFRNSEYRVPPNAEDLNEMGEPTNSHLERFGGALKPGRTWNRNPKVLDINSLNFSFGGCGFNGMYHIGAAAAFGKLVPYYQIGKACGTSAGAMVAALLLGKVPIDVMATTLLHGIVSARSQLSKGMALPYLVMHQTLEQSLQRMLPDNIHELAHEKLYVSVTNAKKKANVVKSTFASKQDLIDVVLASSRIPGFTGLFPVFVQNIGCVDGGMSSNLPQFLKNVITVSPFASNAHISPLDHAKTRDWSVYRIHFADQGIDLTLENIRRMVNIVVPPSKETLIGLFHEGFADAARFMRLNGLIDCLGCINKEDLALTLEMEKGNKCKDLSQCEIIHDSKDSHSHVFRDEPIWDFDEEVEKEKSRSMSHYILNKLWNILKFVFPLTLFAILCGKKDYADNPVKLFHYFCDKVCNFLKCIRGRKYLEIGLAVSFQLWFLVCPTRIEKIHVNHFEEKKKEYRSVIVHSKLSNNNDSSTVNLNNEEEEDKCEDVSQCEIIDILINDNDNLNPEEDFKDLSKSEIINILINDNNNSTPDLNNEEDSKDLSTSEIINHNIHNIINIINSNENEEDLELALEKQQESEEMRPCEILYIINSHNNDSLNSHNSTEGSILEQEVYHWSKDLSQSKIQHNNESNTKSDDEKISENNDQDNDEINSENREAHQNNKEYYSEKHTQEDDNSKENEEKCKEKNKENKSAANNSKRHWTRGTVLKFKQRRRFHSNKRRNSRGSEKKRF